MSVIRTVDLETPTLPARPVIAAVVVTFNRKALLAECLDALLTQTRVPDRIFIVDQASTDGTDAMLREPRYLESSLIAYKRFENNTGGAGGFQRGVELAFAAGADWIWLMDDDAIAEPDALERMESWIGHKGISAIANSKIRLDGTFDSGHVVFEDGATAESTPCYLTFSSFVGLMVSRSAVSKIGFPKAEFFLQGDDTEYCIRLCKAGRILFARDSILIHKEVSRPPEFMRRFGRNFTVYPIDRFCFQYFLWRNRVWIETRGRGYQPGRVLWLISKVFRVIIRTCLIDRTDLSFRLFIIARAVSDGLRGRFDNDFPFRIREKVLASGRGA
jgi:rhamnopyranosyl-N-acetylglucosaminyl-diphospho-decaprenol beta-1,3/1,4-galactofuranosyltransferase